MTSVVLAFSIDTSLTDIDLWTGQLNDTRSGKIQVIDDFSSCDVSYRTISSGKLGKSGKCSMDLSSLSPWEKRHFRIAMHKAGGPFISRRFTAGRVPAGMVLVAKEAWPVEFSSTSNDSRHFDGHSIANGVYGKFDFAIDKYEASLAQGTGDANSQKLSSYQFGVSGANSIKLISQVSSTTSALSAYNWYAFKQGCENRTPDLVSSGFVDSTNLRRSVHLATDLEWFVASSGTPDRAGTPFCNIDAVNTSALKPGDSKTALCISDYGARDMVGNLMEYTDELWSNASGTTSRVTFSGYSSPLSSTMPAPNGGAAIKTQEKFVTGWNHLFAFVSTLGTTASATYNADQFTNIANGASNIASLRGGYYKNSGGGAGASGRYTLWLSYAAAYSSGFSSLNFIGGRCALVGPY